MKITFYSNFLNHHQLPFCKKMYDILGDNFKFVATEPIPKERLKLGYVDMSILFSFTINAYSGNKEYEEAVELGNSSDVVIIGSAPILFVKKRLELNKLTFFYSERMFKKGKYTLLNPKTLGYLLLNHTRYRNKNLHLLCASAYAVSDFKLVGAYKEKAYKWGYFPEFRVYDLDKIMKLKNQNTIVKILWVGRLIEWKHPESIVEIAKRLRHSELNYLIDVIGTGPMEDKLIKSVKANSLQQQVRFLGSKGPDEVRDYMERANIFLFTSDFNEGWGAVLNEAMNSVCAVVASHAAGSVPFLIHNKQNGLIYQNGNIEQLYENIKYLIENREDCSRLGINAYNSISETWNAEEASNRLITICEALLCDRQYFYEDGPCSKALNITQRYIY